MALRDLEQEINVYRLSTFSPACEGKSLSELEAYWTEVLNHCERILKAAHDFRSSAITDRMFAYLEAGSSLDEMPKLHPRTDEPVVDLQRLRSQLPAAGKALEERASVALSVAEVVIDQLNKIEMEVRGTREIEPDPSWPCPLLALCNGYGDVPVCGPWKAPGVSEDDDRAEISEGQMWVPIMGRSEQPEVATSLAEEVQTLKPSLTWAEVIYRFLRSLEDHRGNPVVDKRRRAMSKWTSSPLHTYCMECWRLFVLDSRHLGRFVCPRCRAKHRKREERRRKQLAVPH